MKTTKLAKGNKVSVAKDQNDKLTHNSIKKSRQQTKKNSQEIDKDISKNYNQTKKRKIHDVNDETVESSKKYKFEQRRVSESNNHVDINNLAFAEKSVDFRLRKRILDVIIHKRMSTVIVSGLKRADYSELKVLFPDMVSFFSITKKHKGCLVFVEMSSPDKAAEYAENYQTLALGEQKIFAFLYQSISADVDNYNCSVLHIGNVHNNMTEAELQKFFQKAKSVKLFNDKNDTKKAATADYSTVDDAILELTKLNGKIVHGLPLFVDFRIRCVETLTESGLLRKELKFDPYKSAEQFLGIQKQNNFLDPASLFVRANDGINCDVIKNRFPNCISFHINQGKTARIYYKNADLCNKDYVDAVKVGGGLTVCYHRGEIFVKDTLVVYKLNETNKNNEYLKSILPNHKKANFVENKGTAFVKYSSEVQCLKDLEECQKKFDQVLVQIAEPVYKTLRICRLKRENMNKEFLLKLFPSAYMFKLYERSEYGFARYRTSADCLNDFFNSTKQSNSSIVRFVNKPTDETIDHCELVASGLTTSKDDEEFLKDNFPSALSVKFSGSLAFIKYSSYESCTSEFANLENHGSLITVNLVSSGRQCSQKKQFGHKVVPRNLLFTEAKSKFSQGDEDKLQSSITEEEMNDNRRNLKEIMYANRHK